MTGWQEDLLHATDAPVCEHQIFAKVLKAAIALGFEHCAYGLRLPVPLSSPRILILNNYPESWQQRYADAQYIKVDPTVQHGRQSQKPLIWTEEVFSGVRHLWEDANAHGLCVGWAQSSLDAVGVGGMLSLSRGSEPLGVKELEAQELKMRWLVNIAHISLSRVFGQKQMTPRHGKLTEREAEMLKWTADGKSAQDIADILRISKNTVDFHIKNAIVKLDSANKTAAVVRAAMLGLLN
ncbi:autoinducer binding domain-containing protein [Hydrogenophaga sp. RWCD_12]|uniref:autoinducer binding domain-containing protein n=1 Tax=Hydrogenophaga sp. RWCD_12 TaxID=3391190 RepID=UPI00398542DB